MGKKITSLQFKNADSGSYELLALVSAERPALQAGGTASLSAWLLGCRCAGRRLQGAFNGVQLIILFTRSRMYNSFAMACQPYCLMQMAQPSYPQFLLQPNSQFFLPQFLPLILPNNQLQVLPNGHKSEPVASAALAEPNEAKQTAPTRALPKITQGRQVIKEKIIRKPANRPATYLTQRRFYQAQTIEEEPTAGRKLRPRIFKKKATRPLDSHHSSENQEGCELQRADSVHKEAGSSDLQASSTKKGNSCGDPIADQGSIHGCISPNCHKESSIERSDQ